ncbi:MAG: lysylphosphatidylglycerol synthase transmembrane domain-containing protein [Candidatus Saccharimonadales bacterium]|nr:lysylphosphatidylglycerol synthase transmembrane domain-containing protein [Candidatus Saccharimonadales bacterium]
MSEARRRSKWQWTVIILLAVAFGVLLFSSRDKIDETIDLLRSVDLRILALLPLIQLTSYFFVANYYQRFLGAFKRKVKLGEMYRMVIALYFVEQVLPSGGASGITYLAYALRKVASVGKTTLVQLSRYLLSYTSYILIMIAALAFLIADDEPNFRATLWGSMILAGLIGNIFLVAWLIRHQNAIDGFVNAITRFVNWVARVFIRRRESVLAKETITNNLKAFHDGVDTIFQNKQAVIGPFIFMALSTAMQLLIVYMSFVAIGQWVNPGVIFVSFALANLVGIISVIPGDVGVHEAMMIFVLSSAGVDSAVAVSATLLYRVFNKIIMLSIGFFFYARYLKPAENHG